tara:strand:- start:138 stop:515 length:378 start_codon:yes stop_codon:yes gene_type:complete
MSKRSLTQQEFRQAQTNQESKMAILVKGQITITKGFDTWQKMVYEQDGKLEQHGIKFLFAGTEKENPDQLHLVMMFPNMEAIQTFRNDEELTEKRREAGAVIESGVMTLISDDYFTNYPDAFVKN